MARTERIELLKKLEEVRGNPVLTYVTRDGTPYSGQIGEDAVRPIYDQLAQIGKADKLDLYIYSRGGAMEVPWRIASAMRKYCKTWQLLVPFRANSAATLLGLGADGITLGRHGELGPIDPILTIQRMVGEPGSQTAVQDNISVEDVMAFLRFVQQEVGLTDQSALSSTLSLLSGRLDAVALGSVHRTRTHIRDVARRMIASRSKPPSDRVMETIVETLAERVYAHGHAIGYKEAHDIGLPVTLADEETDSAAWALLEQYEADLKIREPLDPVAALGDDEIYKEDVILAITDCVRQSYECGGEVEVKAKRQVPSTLNVNLNLQIQIPGDQVQVPEQAQQALQQAAQQVQQGLLPLAQQAVEEALKAQAPLSGHEVALRSVAWKRV